MSEPRKIVVGVDDSPEARAALEWACLASRPDDDIAVVHAYSTAAALVPAYLPATPVLPTEDFHQLAKEQLEHIVAATTDRRIRPWVVEGRPGRVIADAAIGADLVVVGHRGESRMSMTIGSTANHALHHLTCPVVVVHGSPPTAPRRVVVGVDDHPVAATTSESVRALRWAYGLPGVEEIRVIHAWSLYPYAWDISGVVMSHVDEFAAGASAVVDHVVELAGPAPVGVRVGSEVVEGLPAQALLQASNDADLLVVGTRGRGGFRGLVLGSTSTQVAAHSHVPVAVIR